MTIAIFGGSFDPPHVGHMLAVAYVLATEPVDEVLVVPCFLHPFAKQLAPFEHRLMMCELAMAWLPRTRISRVEEELGGESRTIRTIEHLRRMHRAVNFRLVVGADVLVDGRRWRSFDRVVELAPLILLGRAGVQAPGAPLPILPDISSTAIRDAIREGRHADIERLVPRTVMTYIVEHHLYVSGQNDSA